jgi:dihydropteroate synthase
MTQRILKAKDKTLELSKRPLLLGILNITPDSFSDGGSFFDKETAISKAHEMIKDGADIIDIGGESTRPFSKAVSSEEEVKRILPVLKMIRDFSIVSIDTRNAKTAEIVLDNGAHIINDISALSDPLMADVVSRYTAAIVLMHMKGTPENMQLDTEYHDLLADISAFLLDRITLSLEKNINRESIVIDPGIGFGKTPQQNLYILNNVNEFTKLGYPVLIGASRKSFMKAIGFENIKERLIPSITTALYSAMTGASFLRVHDVKETKQALDTLFAICDSVNSI